MKGLPVAVLALSLALGLSVAAYSDQPGEAHLPDLRTETPSEFHVEILDSGERQLLFSNTVWNGGRGPLELHPENDPAAGLTYAFQLIFSHDDAGELYVTEQQAAGSFEFHEQHDHWHFSDLARYELVEPGADGGIGKKVVAVSDKIGYCMFDQRQVDATEEHAAPSSVYSPLSCGQNTNVGYSVGWGDEYRYDFPDQDIDISDVAPGNYWVRSTADPENLILETDDENNAASIEIVLTEDEDVLLVTATTGSVCWPCGRTDLRRDDEYAFKGETNPPGEDASIEYSYKRQGTDVWKPFGQPDSNKAFTLLEPGGLVDLEGDWKQRITPQRNGEWVIRGRFPGDGYLAYSAVKIRVTVTAS